MTEETRDDRPLEEQMADHWEEAEERLMDKAIESGERILREKQQQERERNLNRSIDQVWADAEESRMDKLGETLRKANEMVRAAKEDSQK